MQHEKVDGDIEDIENILENIRFNCVIMSEQHKRKFIYLKGILRYFRIPIIILSGLNSVIAVGLQPYIEQGLISVITCLVSLVCGIIGSIELYLSIQSQMENELVTSKEYYLLGIEIYKLLSLHIVNRSVDIKAFMEEKFSQYQKLIEKSNVIVNHYTDKLTQLPGIMNMENEYTSTSSSIVGSSGQNTPLKDLTAKNNIGHLYSHMPMINMPPTPVLNLNMNKQNNSKPTIDLSIQQLSHPTISDNIPIPNNINLETNQIQTTDENNGENNGETEV
tara:strand:- start:6283 stop:7113 length:831 start_codon:yes stop_codon:yes gene_type:complete